MENLQKYITLINKNKDFQKLFAARLITLGGDWLLTVPLLGIIYDLTDNPFITSLVLVVQSAPLFLLGSFGGYLADRFDRKKVLAISEFLSGLVVLLILYAVTTESVAIYIIFICNAINCGIFLHANFRCCITKCCKKGKLS
jgi:MFS family permease